MIDRIERQEISCGDGKMDAPTRLEISAFRCGAGAAALLFCSVSNCSFEVKTFLQICDTSFAGATHLLVFVF
jgi:hypothetical protein